MASCNLKNALAARLKQARSALEMTQKAWCEATGMKLPSLRDYELGNSIPGGEALCLYANAGVSVNWLLTGEGSMFLPAAAARMAALGGDVAPIYAAQLAEQTSLQGIAAQVVGQPKEERASLDSDRLQEAVSIANEGLKAAGARLSDDKYARLLELIYNLLGDQSAVSKDRLMEIIRIAA